jgi:hypothetical protein
VGEIDFGLPRGVSQSVLAHVLGRSLARIGQAGDQLLSRGGMSYHLLHERLAPLLDAGHGRRLKSIRIDGRPARQPLTTYRV